MIGFITIVIFVVVIIPVVIHDTASGDNDNLEYGPTDTHIISVSNALCKDVYFRLGDADPGYEVHLYTLSSPPELTGHENFTLLNEHPLFTSDKIFRVFQDWRDTLSACLLANNSPEITFFMIVVFNSFNSWKEDDSISRDHSKIGAFCRWGNNIHSYSVFSDDFYYLVFRARAPYTDAALNVSVYFDRTLYEVNNSSVINNCSQETSSTSYIKGCTLVFPGLKALL